MSVSAAVGSITPAVLEQLGFVFENVRVERWVRDFGDGISLAALPDPHGWIMEMWNECEGRKTGVGFRNVFTTQYELQMLISFNERLPC